MIFVNDSIRSLQQSGDQVVIYTKGRKGGYAYDAVIGADGPDSQIRNLAFPDAVRLKQPKFLGTTFIQLIVPYSSEITLHPDGVREWWSATKRFAVMPLDDSKQKLLVFASLLNQTRSDAMDPTSAIRFIHEHFKVLRRHKVVSFINSLRRGNLLQAQAFCSNPGGFYSQTDLHGNVLLVGESAHAIHPTLFQREAIGIEDAYVLGKKLSDTSIPTVRQALEQYSSERASRINQLQSLSRAQNSSVHFSWPFKAIRTALMPLGLSLWRKNCMSRAFKPIE